jgi:hypothetical protein
LFTAVSFFLPTRFELPAAFLKTRLNYVPVLFVVISMITWLLRVLFTDTYRNSRATPTARAAVTSTAGDA